MLLPGDRILITGASGQLGNQFKELSRKIWNDIDLLSRTDVIIHDIESVRKAVKYYKPKYFINCAAYTAVDKAETEKEEAYLVNGDAPGIMAQVCKELDINFIHISTDYVFDGLATVPYKEDNPTGPQGIYGASKLEGEKRVFLLNEDAMVIRTSWLYAESGKNFVRTMLQLMRQREEIGVVNDQAGSPTYAADLANAILRILNSSWQPGTYHFCNDGAITWYDFAVAIKELNGFTCKINPITTADYPTPAIRPPYSVLDTTKIQQVYGIKPRYWKEALEGCLVNIKN
jgi:dTDP-4-dehydrorhamnose reductase